METGSIRTSTKKMSGDAKDVIEQSMTERLTDDGLEVDILENGQSHLLPNVETEELSMYEDYNYWWHLVLLFVPNIDIITDVLVLIFYFEEGGDYKFWGVILAVVLALSLRIQTFWFLIFFFYVEANDEEEFKDQDSMIMYVPLVGPFVASHGLVGEIGYEGPICGRLFWCLIFEVTLWIGIPFMLIMRGIAAMRSWLQWVWYLIRGCKESNRDDIEDQGRIISKENRHLLLAFINSSEALYEAFPQLITQMVVILSLSKGDTNTRQYVSLAFSAIVTLKGLGDTLHKVMKKKV